MYPRILAPPAHSPEASNLLGVRVKEDKRRNGPTQCSPVDRRFLQQLHQAHGIHPRLVYGDSPMQMRPGDAARGADLSQNGIRLHIVPYRYIRGRQVAVQGVHPQTVIDDDRVAGKIQRLGQNYAAALRGVYRSSRGSWEIRSGV